MRTSALWPAALCLLLSGAHGQTVAGNAQDNVVVERGVEVKMRDGVVLRADIYRPRANGKYPVILERTPYNKAGDDGTGRMAAARGYVCIVQDTRGRWTSDGDFYTFKYEPQDGYDTVEWAAQLPYSNGRVGMFGASYVGATQWLAAIANPPHLVALFPVVTASNYHDGWTYQGGALEQWFDESWTSALAQDTVQHLAKAQMRTRQWIWDLPLEDYPVLDVGGEEFSHKLAPYFDDWLAHPDYDEYWKQWSIEENYPKLRVQAYDVGGWYDIFLRGTLRNYVGMKASAATGEARSGQRLVIGPWYHGPMTGKTGELDFGPQAKLEEEDLMLRWFDAVLKGVRNTAAREKPVRIFVMGTNVWRDEDDWPLARARNTSFYLHSAGHANSSSGNGTLSTAAPAAERRDAFIYDPADPVPTRGGPLCCDNDRLPSGAFDQRAIEAREDVLVYTIAPLTRDLEVTGPLFADLYMSSSAVDTDITAKLVDVWPNGYAQNLSDGILRARYRNSAEKPEYMNPGQIYRVRVDLGATSNVFRIGHRVRVEISSSNFPRFDRNLNTGEAPETSVKLLPVENRIYHDRAHPSAIILPVVP